MSNYQQLKLEKFSEGMIDEDQLSRVHYPEGACVDAQNVMFMPTGTMKRRPGYVAMHTTSAGSGSPITRSSTWTTTGGVDYALVFTCQNATCASTAQSAYMYTVEATGVGGNVATLCACYITGTPATAWDPSETEPIVIAAYAGSAVMTHWGNPDVPIIFDGATASANLQDVAACPSGAKTMVAWGNFLFLGNVLVGGVRHGSRIQWNAASNISSWPAAQYIELDADDGDEITAMGVYRDKLIVWKKYKMYVIHYVGGTLMFQEERISNGIGCLGPGAFMEYAGSLYFIGAYTVYEWSGSGEPTSISDKIQGQWDNMNISIGRCFDVDSDDSNWQIWFAVATGSTTYKNLIFVYDPRFKSWTKFNIICGTIGSMNFGTNKTYAHYPLAYDSYSEKIEDAAGEKEGILLIGTRSGFLCEYGSVDNDDGSAIDAYWISPWLDFGIPDKNKRILRYTAFVERLGTYNLHVDLYKDWNADTVNLQKTISLSGSVSVPMVERRVDFTTQCRAAQLKIYTDAADEPFTLHRMIIDWNAKGHKLIE